MTDKEIDNKLEELRVKLCIEINNYSAITRELWEIAYKKRK